MVNNTFVYYFSYPSIIAAICWLGNCASTDVIFLSYNFINDFIFLSTAFGILPDMDEITS